MKRLIQKTLHWLREVKASHTYYSAYRVVDITQNEDELYTVMVQVLNKRCTFYMKPEEILSNDKLVDLFSPRDVRMLTYLGYLCKNAPQYKILAQRLSATTDQMVFALKHRASQSIVTKTAKQIMQDSSIVHSISSKDATAIGYVAATESLAKCPKDHEKK